MIGKFLRGIPRRFHTRKLEHRGYKIYCLEQSIFHLDHASIRLILAVPKKKFAVLLDYEYTEQDLREIELKLIRMVAEDHRTPVTIEYTDYAILINAEKPLTALELKSFRNSDNTIVLKEVANVLVSKPL